MALGGKHMDDFSDNKYTSEEVTRIIRRALEMKREETVNHQDLLHTAEELGIDAETVAEAIKIDKADVEIEQAQKERLQRKKPAFAATSGAISQSTPDCF